MRSRPGDNWAAVRALRAIIDDAPADVDAGVDVRLRDLDGIAITEVVFRVSSGVWTASATIMRYDLGPRTDPTDPEVGAPAIHYRLQYNDGESRRRVVVKPRADVLAQLDNYQIPAAAVSRLFAWTDTAAGLLEI